MSQRVTLGGDRLGSGKRMKVELHGYERSTHDLGYVWRSTMSAGTLVPFMCQVALPADTWDIHLDADIKTHPTVGPLFGTYKVQLDVFQAPLRLYNAALHNNKIGIGMEMQNVTLPQITLEAQAGMDAEEIEDLDNSQINPSSLLAYIGIRGVGFNGLAGVHGRSFNITAALAYWEIYKNYYANKQEIYSGEVTGAVVHFAAPSVNQTVDVVEIRRAGAGIGNIPLQGVSVGNEPMQTGDQIIIYYTGAKPDASTILVYHSLRGWVRLSDLGLEFSTGNTGEYGINYNANNWGVGNILQYWNYEGGAGVTPSNRPQMTFFPLQNIDKMRDEILQTPMSTQFYVNDVDLVPYKYLYEKTAAGVYYRMYTQEGLALKTYQSDKFNNWLNTENLAQISAQSAVSTLGNMFTMDQLLIAEKVYQMLNRIAVSGGTYDDWLTAIYDHEGIQRAESPIYHGGLIRELVFQEVVSNTETGDQPLGTIGGKGVMSDKRKGGNIVIKVDEPSYIIGIISLTPRIDYSQGNKWDVHLKSIDDLHKPQLDEIGFQDLMNEEMAWWDTYAAGLGVWTRKSVGKQPAWLNYMTNTNITLGNFAIPENEMFMTLNRRYEAYLTGGSSIHIKDLTTYIDPEKFNFIFAETALDAQNFWAQIGIGATVRRKMSAKLMPNL